MFQPYLYLGTLSFVLTLFIVDSTSFAANRGNDYGWRKPSQREGEDENWRTGSYDVEQETAWNPVTKKPSTANQKEPINTYPYQTTKKSVEKDESTTSYYPGVYGVTSKSNSDKKFGEYEETSTFRTQYNPSTRKSSYNNYDQTYESSTTYYPKTTKPNWDNYGQEFEVSTQKQKDSTTSKPYITTTVKIPWYTKVKNFFGRDFESDYDY